MYHDNGIKVVATIEARMTSSRLPGKALMHFCGKPNLQHIVERLGKSKYVDQVVVATTINKTDDPINDLCKKIGCACYRGSEDDVLLRVLETAKQVNAGILVEITGDCPLVDWRIVDELIALFFSGQYDYVSNIIKRTYPDGFDVQVFPVSVLEEVNRLTADPQDHEHVSLYIYNHPEKYRLKNKEATGIMRRSDVEVTLDTAEDYRFLEKIFDALYPKNKDFSAVDVVEFLNTRPELMAIVEHVKRNY